MEIDNRFIKVSIDDLKTPNHGQEVIANSWWAAKDGHVLGFKAYGAKSKKRPTPQCNSNKAVADMVISKMYPGHEAVYIGTAYWPPMPSNDVDHWDDKGPKMSNSEFMSDSEDFEFAF